MTDTHRHHGDDDARGMRTNFAVNVQGTSPTGGLVEHLAAELNTLGNYPSSTRLKNTTQLVAEWLGVPADRVLLVAGAAEGFSLLAELRPPTAYVFDPGFAEPRDTLTDQGINVTTIACGPQPISDGYRVRDHYPPTDTAAGGATGSAESSVAVTVEANGSAPTTKTTASAAADSSCGAVGRDMVIVSNPTNPLGQCFTAKQLLHMADGMTLVADEAFADVSPAAESLLPRAATDSTGRLIVLRSLTKTHNLAGLRCGIVVAHPETLKILARRRPHWALSSLQLAAFEWIATHTTEGDLAALADRIAADRDHLIEQMTALGFRPIGQSGAPYVTFQVPGTAHQAEHLRLGLREKSIAVRRCDTFPSLGAGYWRLAVKDPDTTNTLINALRTLL